MIKGPDGPALAPGADRRRRGPRRQPGRHPGRAGRHRPGRGGHPAPVGRRADRAADRRGRPRPGRRRPRWTRRRCAARPARRSGRSPPRRAARGPTATPSRPADRARPARARPGRGRGGRARRAARRLRVHPVPAGRPAAAIGAHRADPGGRPTGGTAAARAEALADAVSLVRDLVNTAPSDLVPATLADGGGTGRRRRPGCSVEVLDEKALERGRLRRHRGRRPGLGAPAAAGPAGVHAGAGRTATQTVVFVGKGITFDSGGLSLKPPKSMETMKIGHGRGGRGARRDAGDRRARPGGPVIGYLMCTENMPSGSALTPVRRDHHLRRHDRRGAEHRRGGPPGDGRRAGQVGRRAAPRRAGGHRHAHRRAAASRSAPRWPA